VGDNRQNEMIDHLKSTRIGTQVRKFWLATRYLQSISIKREIVHYLWKSMMNETLKFIAMHRIGHLSKYIAIHIRKGDKLKTEACEISLNKYIAAIERIL
jgi:hypothetical protein